MTTITLTVKYNEFPSRCKRLARTLEVLNASLDQLITHFVAGTDRNSKARSRVDEDPGASSCVKSVGCFAPCDEQRTYWVS